MKSQYGIHVYIRFRIEEKDRYSGKPKGLFWAIDDLRKSDALSTHQLAQANALLAWFNRNLPVPTSFSKSTRPHAAPMALSWFKDSASECILKMRDIASILETHDVIVTMLKTPKPGYIVYEDEYQVAAQPFPDTPI